jgi:glycosyltransferase involved in cell wall biosynthesis
MNAAAHEVPRTSAHAPDGERPPTVTVALPVYNGEAFLEEALDGLLAQSYTDFELLISDNASSDATASICATYADRDPRIRYLRQATNIGAVPNHNLLVGLARGRYFKWVGHDDLFEPELLRRCVEGLESHPEAVLANVWDGVVDAQGRRAAAPYLLDAANSQAHLRFRSLLREDGGNDVYGLIRTDRLRGIHPMGSFLHADRAFVAELILNAPFHHVEEVLYFRREHPGRTSHAPRARDVVTRLDPARAKHSVARLYLAYVADLFASVRRARLTTRERLLCWRQLVWFLLSRVRPATLVQVVTGRAPRAEPPAGTPLQP